MKLMLIVAFAFIVGASAQCDVQDCLNRFQQALTDAGSDTTAILLATSNFCNEDCVSACSNDASFSAVKQTCDQLPPAACLTCLGEYTDAIAAASGDDAIVDATRKFCKNSCVNDCSGESTFAGVKAACDALSGGATPVYTVVTLLSAMFFAGMAMIFN